MKTAKIEVLSKKPLRIDLNWFPYRDIVNEEDFDRIKKKHYGNFIMNFNDIDSISNSLIGSYFNGEGLFDQLSVLESITIDDVNDRIRTAINIENSSMSVIKQK